MESIKTSQNIVPFLWYDNKAEEAMKLYTSLFPNSKILSSKKWGAGSPYPPDTIMMGTILIDGLKIHMFDAGPHFKFNEAISLVMYCDTQAELDRVWKKLKSGGGKEVCCGWLKDKYGLSWQIVPTILGKLTSDRSPTKAARVMKVVMNSVKLDIKKLKAAYGGK